MIYIYKNRQIAIEWTILREKGVLEDLAHAINISCFLITPNKERKIVSSASENPLYIILSQDLEEGVYSLELIWQKKSSADSTDRITSRSRAENIFTITSNKTLAKETTATCTVYVKSLVAIYGYDGLDAYELSVLRRKTNLSEDEWLSETQQRLANLEQTVEEGALKTEAYPVDAFPTRGNTSHVVSSDGVYKVAENMQYVKSNNLCDASACVEGNIYPNTGEIRPNTSVQDYKTTDFIPVTSGKNYVCSISGELSPLRFIAYYDNYKTFISCFDSVSLPTHTYSFVPPEGCSFVRVTPYFDPTKNDYQIEQGEAPTAYTEYADGYKVTSKKILDGSITIQKFKDQEVKNIFKALTVSKTLTWDIAYRQLSLPLEQGTIILDTNATELIFHVSPQVPSGETAFRLKPSDLPYTIPFDTYYVRSTKAGEFYINYANTSVSLNLSENSVAYNMLSRSVQSMLSDKNTNHSCIIGTLNGSNTLSLSSNCVKTFKRIDFAGTFTSKQDEWSLTIGHGTVTDYTGSGIRITSQGVSSFEYYGSELTQKQYDYPYSSGFSFGSDINVSISKETTGYNALLIIQSNGNVFKQRIRWIGDVGNVYATSANATLNSCTLEFTPFKSQCDIWLFGDSYISLGDPKRWAYYLMNEGYTDLLLCGYSGAKSSVVASMLSELISKRAPKYLVWTLGMNDKDNASDTTEATAPNSAWLTATKQVLSLCRQNCTIPILATIPTVKGKSTAESDSGVSGFRNHSKKNEWVKNSGYRYIDFATAVNANDETGEWYEGHLSDDGVHPTAEGAKALYARILVDFLEITTCKPY